MAQAANVVEGVVAEAVACGAHHFKFLGMLANVVAHHEEGGAYVVVAQDVEHPRRDFWNGSVVESEVDSALVGVHPPEGVGVEPAKEAGRLFDNHFSSISLVMAGPRLWGRIANLLRCCRLRAWLCISVGFLRPRPLRLAF